MAIKNIDDIIDLETRCPDPFVNLPQNTYKMIERTALSQPEAPALSFIADVEHYTRPATWTYRELLADITRAANLFRRLGVNKGDAIAYILPNLPETHITLWAAETAGVAFAINTMLEGEQMGTLLHSANTRWIVTVGPDSDPEIWSRVEKACPLIDALQGVLIVDGHRHHPDAAGQHSLPTVQGQLQVLDFHLELDRESGDELNFEGPQRDDISDYIGTGGTTGMPKIAMHTHANDMVIAEQLRITVGDAIFSPGKVFMTALPLYHVNAQFGTGLPVFHAGGHVLLAPPQGYRSPGLLQCFWNIVEHYRVVSFSGVPTVFAALLQTSTQGRDLSCLERAICGAAPLPVDLFRKFQDASGVKILEGYGLTESTVVASLNPTDGEPRIGSVGLRLPWQDMQTVILDEEGSFVRKAEIDEVGIIALIGPNIFPGYFNPLQNKEVWIEIPDDQGATQRWLNTGDLGRQDSEGYFWLTGRKKELIIRGGHNIDPKMIEEALASHPRVALAAAVGRPDAYAGEVPVAYVQLRAGEEITEQELIDFARERIAEPAAVPKAINILPSLPLTTIGKIFKPALVMKEVEFVVRTVAQDNRVELDILRVEQDTKLGLVARYRVNDACADVLRGFAEALGLYSFNSEQLVSH